MILLIDNYDSFTYNIAQYFQMLGTVVRVVPNDQQKIDFNPTHLVVGPGPGTPADSKNSIPHILNYLGKIPILGVCLGHQCIAEIFGGHVLRAKKAVHGKVSKIIHDGQTLFSGINTPFMATRYHSLVVKRENLPKVLKISCETEDGEIMGIRHTDYLLEGVQFHPESISTEHGLAIFQNFLNQQPGFKQ